jgi:DNA-binding HxlR family transcriptional regulator
MKRTDRRSDCPTNFALQVFGDSWSLLIVRDLMFKGKRTFAEFAASDEQIATNVLTDRLRALARSDIIRRDGMRRATRYSLSAKGIDLLPLMIDRIIWSARYDARSAAPAAFVRRATRARAKLLAEIRARLVLEHAVR